MNLRPRSVGQLAAVGLLLAATAHAASPGPASAPSPRRVEVELLTMSRGAGVYERFGHAALRVRTRLGELVVSDRVYNWGATDFQAPGLVLSFLRGRVRFWVAVASYGGTLAYYRRHGRAVYRHRLALSPDEQRELAAMLARERRPDRRYYTYHHYDDNCSTRVRDLLDRALGGRLRAQLGGRATGLTHRDLTRTGFAGRPELLLLSELIIGRRVDVPLDGWQAGFLPALLVEQLRTVQHRGRPLIGPVLVASPAPAGDPVRGNPLAGRTITRALAVALVLLAGLGWLGIARRRRWAGLCWMPPALVGGLCAALIWTLALFSTLSDLRVNELLLLLWPTDLLLCGFAVRLLRGRFFAGRWLRGYCLVRVVAVLLAGGGQLSGLLIQRPLCWLPLVGGPFLLLWFASRRLPIYRSDAGQSELDRAQP